MFEQAVRNKLRFPTPQGSLSVEDLWDLPLTSTTGKANLDALAVNLFKKVKERSEVSFVTPKEDSSSEDQLKFDIVKHVLDIKLAERTKAHEAAQAKERRQKLLEVIDRKENKALEDMPLDELRKMVEGL